MFRDKTKALEVLQIRSKSYEGQIKTIEETHKKEIEARDQILKNSFTLSFTNPITWSCEKFDLVMILYSTPILIIYPFLILTASVTGLNLDK